MRSMKWIAASLVATALAGCLTFERATYRVTYDAARKLGTTETTYYNLQSDAETADEQEDDFRGLVAMWKDDAFLLDRAREEVYVKDRKLAIEQGILVGVEHGIIGDLASIDFKADSTGTVWWSDRNMEVLRSNGTVSPEKDGVSWPPGTNRFELEVRTRDFHSRTDFAKRFRGLRKR